MNMPRAIPFVVCAMSVIHVSCGFAADSVPIVADVEGQPLGANVSRLLDAFTFLGQPLSQDVAEQLRDAARRRDSAAMQELLDPLALCVVQINPELRVKVTRGPGVAQLHQGGFTPLLVKVVNDGEIAAPLAVRSPQGGKVYGGVAPLSLERQQQTELGVDQNTENESGRFLDVEVFTARPMTEKLSGLNVEYVILLLHSTEAGRREATLTFDVGQGTQDLGFRSELPVLFDVSPAIPVTLAIKETDGTATTARLTFRDRTGRVYPPQAKRLAPDFFFQPHIYRNDGETVLLPPGTYELTSCRGPEYREIVTEITVVDGAETVVEAPLERWIDPTTEGWYSGDHHIHAAGCSHYQSPTLGVEPPDMFRQVKGEGLNVGCVLTWGPCYDHQRQFFSPLADAVSEPLTILKYDLEISGFGSAPLGHVCLLNLRDQTYPGSNGTSTQGWPSWTGPVMRWAKAQGGMTGDPHSDMRLDPAGYAKWKFGRLDADGNGRLSSAETEGALLPEPFASIDADRDGAITPDELAASADRRGNDLPNTVLPSMLGSGAMEIFVTVPEGVCDFISAMDTGRIGEWNTWYHLMNCGFPLKVSGETDFPCMSSRRVGQGRVYVKLAEEQLKQFEFPDWCNGIAAGRSYVSDGYSHALEFSVNGVSPGFGQVDLAEAGTVDVRARVAFAPSVPEAVAHGTQPVDSRRESGDTRVLHTDGRSERLVSGGVRTVELVVNGRVAASIGVPADGAIHELQFTVPVEQSSWVALRQFPQMHTNPVDVLVGGAPIRASRASAEWCAESVELLWTNRSRHISEAERPAARAAYDRALAEYHRRAAESVPTN